MTTTHNFGRTSPKEDSTCQNDIARCPPYTLSSELEEHSDSVEYGSSAAVTSSITIVGSTSASSNQSRAKQTRAKKSYTKKNRARRAQAQSTSNMQDQPALKRTNLKIYEKREIIGITSLFNSACYKIVGLIFNVARQTVHGICKQVMKEKLSKVPQEDNWTSRVRTRQSVSTMDTEAETEVDPQSKKGPLDGMTMAIEAICKLLNRPIDQIPDMMHNRNSFKDELEKYLIIMKQQIEKGGKTRPEGSFFENFSLRWILIPDISDFDPAQCKRKIIFNNPQDFELFTLSNFLIWLDGLNDKKTLLLIDEVQWNLLRASSTAPLPDTKYVYVMVVPSRLRSILPLNCLAKRFKDFICRKHDPKDVEIQIDQQASTLRNFLCQTYTSSEIQERFNTFSDNVGIIASVENTEGEGDPVNKGFVAKA
ncbi:hypothetical protein BGX21_010798 [Mortierella sp. AD011]|nr:hypothetical protein BGX20_009165 [Mortierella sp. AD010]KAF9393313.1 hypothetical protein BGX21_010798 [Mortierella sp. AD011]